MSTYSSKSVEEIDDGAVVSVRNLGINFPPEKPTLQAEINSYTQEIRGWLEDIFKGRRRSPFGVSPSRPQGKWVFRNLSFDVYPGEVLGVIGGNGCGKTTLLKILSNVLFPTEGHAIVRGRVASLLGVGTGFNLEFTGRENVFLNGMLLGLSKREIERCFGSIVAFADIGDAVEMPVRTYSSGMRARLAFAVAAQLRSDIVILDEVLSVGDAGFREKSQSVIQRMKYEGRTIILVSHNMSAIENYCDRAMVIRDGSTDKIGETENVIQRYLDSFKVAKAEEVELRDRQDREGTGALRVVNFRLETGSGLLIHQPQAGDDVFICLEYECEGNRPVWDVDFGLAFFSNKGYKLSRFATDNIGSTFAELPAKGAVKLHIPRFPYAQGTYLIGFRVTVGGEVADYMTNAFEITATQGDFYGTGAIDDHSPVLVPHDWAVENASKHA